MNDRDIEDTRQEPDYHEWITCIVCQDDFPIDEVSAVQGYGNQVFGFCRVCVEKINEEAKRGIRNEERMIAKMKKDIREEGPMEVIKKEDLKIDEWRDYLQWRPSQCYYHTTYKKRHYVLYLRWRWDDPWQGHIIKDATSEDIGNMEWSADLFAKNNVEFIDTELDKAKEKLIELLVYNL